MNILVLNYEFPPIGGGGGPVSRDLAIELVKRGHKVSVVTMGFQNLPREEILGGVHVYRVKCWRKKASVCHPWEQMTYIYGAMQFLKMHLKEQKYDICHAHFIIPTGVVAYMLQKRYRIPYIMTAHGSDVEGYNSQRFKLMHVLLRTPWAGLVNHARKVVSPSDYLMGLLKKQKSHGDFVLIPNGFDVDYYQKLVPDESIKTHTILVMGRMQKAKNMQIAISAFAKTKPSDWTLQILGDGPYREELEQLIQELQIADRVILHGWVENKSEKQLAILKKASIYISGSYFENCPMAVLESIAAKCYPLLSDIAAHRQIINDDKYFFDPDNADELASKLEETMQNGHTVQKSIDLSRYQWKKVVDAYEQVLKKQ